jgi:iron transport multicopper oxidase
MLTDMIVHCHIEWHVEAGKTVTFIEAPDRLQQTLRIPPDHLDACKKMKMPTAGNCAGNTKNPLDISQCVTKFDANPVGAYVGPLSKRAAREFSA